MEIVMLSLRCWLALLQVFELEFTPNLFLSFFKFSRHHNKIRTIDGSQTVELVSVETLDLSNNEITELRGQCFPASLQIKDL